MNENKRETCLRHGLVGFYYVSYFLFYFYACHASTLTFVWFTCPDFGQVAESFISRYVGFGLGI